MQGVVKWFSDQRGYGFIQQDDGSQVFVRWNDVEGQHEPYTQNLVEGDVVEYDVEETPRGLRARNVRVTQRVKRVTRSVWTAIAELERRIAKLEERLR